jgi:LysM repeat protein
MSSTKQIHTIVVAALFVVLIGAVPYQHAQAQSSAETTIHIVAWGETLSSIAVRYGVTVSSIMTANHLAQADRIFAGQALVIPGSGMDGAIQQDGGQHIVQQGETLYRISVKYGVGIEALMAANSLSNADHIYAGQILVIPQAGYAGTSEQVDTNQAETYVVRAGDTLSGISLRFGVSLSALQTTNNLINPSQIYGGQTLVIPGAASASTGGYTPTQATVTHVVQFGETLLTIASRYGVSVWVIAQSNNISNVSLIYPGQVLSFPASNALASPSEAGSVSGQSIMVDVSDQRVYVYENGVLQHDFIASTGLPGSATRRGNFEIQNKIPVAYAATWDLQMPYWLGFYWAGPLQNGFHALPILSNGVRLWEGLLGSPASYGCVILSDANAQWLYEWANIGTPVRVQD